MACTSAALGASSNDREREHPQDPRGPQTFDAAIAKLALTCGGQCAITNAPGLRATIEMILEHSY